MQIGLLRIYLQLCDGVHTHTHSRLRFLDVADELRTRGVSTVSSFAILVGAAALIHVLHAREFLIGEEEGLNMRVSSSQMLARLGWIKGLYARLG